MHMLLVEEQLQWPMSDGGHVHQAVAAAQQAAFGQQQERSSGYG